MRESAFVMLSANEKTWIFVSDWLTESWTGPKTRDATASWMKLWQLVGQRNTVRRCSDCDKIWILQSFIWLCSRSGSNFDGLICICSNDFQPIYLSNISLTFLFFELWRRFSMLLVMCATSITSTFNIWSFLNFLCFWSSYLIPWGIFSLIKYCRKTKCL